MTTRKGQNSILFITTLGVYLGLVLVGASPQIIAQQAATTKNFDVREETKLKNSLDNDPDNDPAMLADSVLDYLQDVEQLLTSLGHLNRKGQFDPSVHPFEVAQSVALPCVPFNKAGSYTAEKFDNSNVFAKPFLERFGKQLNYGYSLGDCVQNSSFPDNESVLSHFNFKLDPSAFTVEIRVKKSSSFSASRLAAVLPRGFKLFATKDAAAMRQAIINNTSYRAENDQVFVVTRLPRASIDSLFAALK